MWKKRVDNHGLQEGGEGRVQFRESWAAGEGRDQQPAQRSTLGLSHDDDRETKTVSLLTDRVEAESWGQFFMLQGMI
jgi:hypothetical protein